MNPGVFNLTVHGVGDSPHLDEPERGVWLEENEFFAALDALASQARRQTVRLTFDDGNKSDLTIALPALVERGLTAEFFICAGRLENEAYLSKDDLGELTRAQMSIGSHGMEHRAWRGLTDQELAREVIEARDVLSEVLSQDVTHAACPYGEYDRRSLAMLQRAGFRRVYTSDGGMANPRSWLQGRTTLRRGHALAQIDRLLKHRSRLVALAGGLKQRIKQWR